IQIKGFLCDFESLLPDIIDHISAKNFDGGIVKSQVQCLIDDVHSYRASEQYSLALNEIRRIGKLHFSHSNQKLVENLSCLDDFNYKESLETFLSGMSCKVIAFGTDKPHLSQKIIEIISDGFAKNKISLKKLEMPSKYYRTLEDGEKIETRITNTHDKKNKAATFYFPLGQTSNENIAKVKIIDRLFSDNFFNILRTEKQYGYVCRMTYFINFDYVGIQFILQSDKLDSAGVKNEILDFIESYLSSVKDISDDKWQSAIKSELDILNDNQFSSKQDFNKLINLAGRENLKLSNESLKTYDFQSEFLKNISKDDIHEIIERYMINPETRRYFLSISE
ncbi:MAG: hypothetical protein MHPSP_002759, partial [Paramarteilia canceri]